jgi:undecaprenyl-diphosphatase
MKNLFFLQIIFEVLPISSSGHLELIYLIIKYLKKLTFKEELLAHIPTMIIQFFVIIPLIKKIFNNFSKKRLLIEAIMLSVLTGVTAIGIFAKHFIKNFLDIKFPLWIGFYITSLLLLSLKILLDKKFNEREKEKEYLTFKDAFKIGIFQCFAFLPGVSRFAVTLVFCKLLRLSNRYSFFISVISGILLSFGGTLIVINSLINNSISLIDFYDLKVILFGINVCAVSLFLFCFIIKLYFYNWIWILGFYEIIIASIAMFYFG